MKMILFFVCCIIIVSLFALLFFFLITKIRANVWTNAWAKAEMKIIKNEEKEENDD